MTKNFGYETKGGDATETEKFLASKFVCPDAGILNSISVYIENGDSVAHNIQVGIYNDEAGVMGTKVVSSASVSIPAAFNNWKTIDISAALVLGSAYWLVIQIETLHAAFFVYYDGGDANQRAYKAAWTYGDWSDNPVGFTYDAQKLSIYATYTEAEASPYTWGMMFKSQIDPETIEGAIARLIAVHEADPTSHLDTGESLQSHKALAIIDHIAGSVLADKLSNSEDIFETAFESIAGWGKVGTVTLDEWPGVYLYIEYGVVNLSDLMTTIIYPENWLDYTKNIMFQFSGWITTAVASKFTANLGFLTSPTNINGFGFQCVNGVVKGYWGKGASITFTATLSVDESKIHVYRAYYDAFLQNVKFYIDGVYQATIENIGLEAAFEAQIEFRADATAATSGYMRIKKLLVSREV